MMRLESKLSNESINATDIPNLSDEQLTELIDGTTQKTTSEQLKEAKGKVDNARKEARSEYLQSQRGLAGKVKEVLYDLNIKSPESELSRKLKYMRKRRLELEGKTDILRKAVEKSYFVISYNEKRCLAIDVKIERRKRLLEEKKVVYEEMQQRLADEEMDNISATQVQCDSHQSYMDLFTIQNELKYLMSEYVLSFRKTDKLKNIVAGKEADLQRLMETKFDIEQKIQEIELLMGKNVSPTDVLDYMEDAYTNIECCEREINHVLKKSNSVSSAISQVKFVSGKSAAENEHFYKENARIARQVQDGFELEYQQIKETMRRK